jgi:hypothetical protein
VAKLTVSFRRIPESISGQRASPQQSWMSAFAGMTTRSVSEASGDDFPVDRRASIGALCCCDLERAANRLLF